MFKHVALVIALALTLQNSAYGQTIEPLSSLSSVTQNAFAYFKQVEAQRLNDFLRRVRPGKLAPELRMKVLNMLPKSDLVNPSAEGQDKLRALAPILKYHERDGVIEFRILRVRTATAVFLAGAAVLITEPALEILTTAELQAVVAHELGHEYYWNEFEIARQRQLHDRIKELELRCDGIAVVTLNQLNLDPENLLSAITRLNKYNERVGPVNSENYVSLKERLAFIRSMIQLIRQSAR